MNHRCLTQLASAIAILIAAGCGPRAGTEPTAEVTGKVTLDGEPIAGVSVAFIPESGRPGSGLTDETGNFVITTFETGDGAILGKHAVVLSEAVNSETPAPEDPAFLTWKPPKPRFAPVYSEQKRTPFSAEVKEDEENHFEFDMTTTNPPSR